MASWQGLHLSFGLDTGLAAKRLCWRCALRQTWRHSSTVQSAVSGELVLSQKSYDALARSKRENRIRHERQVRGLPTRTRSGDPSKPSDPSHQSIFRYHVSKSLPLVRRQIFDDYHKEVRIHLGGLDHKDEQWMSHLRRRGIGTEFVPSASVNILNNDGNEVRIRSGGPNPEPDPALQVSAAKNVSEPKEFVVSADAEIALDNVLNGFQELRSRMAQHSQPIRRWRALPNRYDSVMSPRIRNYTTCTARYASHEVPEFSPAEYQPAIEIPINKHLGVRDRLRAWQKQQNADLEILMPSGFPDSKLNSQQNLLAQSGTGDGENTLFRDDESQDELMLRMDAEDQIIDATDDQTFLRKGDLVEFLTTGEPILAIFIRNFAAQSQFYTMQGKWVHRLPQRVKFSVSRFSTSDAVDRIVPYLPTEQVAEDMLDSLHNLDISVPREAGAELIEKMLRFHKAANSTFRKYADRLDHAHKIMAHPTERRWLSLEEAATELLQIRGKSTLNDAMLWAVHRVLVKTVGIRMSNKKHRLSPIFDILPRRDVDELSRVRKWLRDYQEGMIATAMTGVRPKDNAETDNPFYNFLPKARTLITESRKRRAVTELGALGPSSVKVTPVEPQWAVWKSNPGMRFTGAEKQILEFINIWIKNETLVPGSILTSLGPMILRATGMYEGFVLKQDVGAVFLQEMGVIPPWQNRLLYSPTLNLPGHRLDPKTDRLFIDSEKSSDKFVMKDSMQSFRRDWGDLEVFCVDDADVAERDDGISLEAIDGKDSEYWIHIHVANPSAFITPDSGLARYAGHVTESVYFPERRFPMLNADVVANHFSLAINKPTITFSAKINADGEILDTKVVNGIIRNVRHITRKTLRQYISFGDTPLAKEIKNITVGRANPESGTIPQSIMSPNKTTAETLITLNEPQVATLSTLCELGAARRLKREQNGAISMMTQQIPRIEPSVYFQADGKAPSLLFDRHSQRIEGDPIISLDYTEFDPTSPVGTRSSETLVPDCMILAGEIAATWCAQRNIPIAYRGTIRNPEPAIPPEQYKKEVIDPAIATHGSAPLVANLRYLSLIGASTLSPSPLAHTILGAPYYCKITSPLRRYADLMAHWQIEAAIRYEAETGRTLIGNATHDSYLPFRFPKAEAAISHISRRETIISRSSRSSARHWYTQLLFRAFYFKEAPVPDTFKVYVYGANNSNVKHMRWAALTREFGVAVDLEDNELSRAAGGIRVGDWWEAKIDKIQCHTRYIVLSPLKLIHKATFTY